MWAGIFFFSPHLRYSLSMTELATFAAGCFWGVEDIYRQVPGVIDVISGYTGGEMENPTYQDVGTDKTGHAEAVEVTYDPEKVGYEKLVQIFWDNHNPTTMNRQGPDIGTQYRSAIFYHSDEQRKIAEKSKADLEASKKWKEPIVTEIVEAKPFYKAEEYHQRYLEKHGLSNCHI
jgi:peptide-methionine (S)-S-oxide reductase